MYQYNPVRDSCSSITTLLPISSPHFNSSGNANGTITYNNANGDSTTRFSSLTNLGPHKNVDETTLPKNKDPTSDGNIIITISDYNKLKISYIDIRLNSFYKNMIIIQQQENIMNNNNNTVNISGKVVLSVLKPLLLYKPITLELRGNFKLDFIEINKNDKKKYKHNELEEDRMDTVVVKESRLIFLAKWGNLLDQADGEVVDLCKNKFDKEQAFRYHNKNKLKGTGSMKTFNSGSLTNMLKRASFISQNSCSNKESDTENNNQSDVAGNGFSVSPVTTHDNVFNNSKSSVSKIRPQLNSTISTASASSKEKLKSTSQIVTVLDPDISMNHRNNDLIKDVVDKTDTKIYMPAGNYEFPFRVTVNEKDLPDTIEGLQTGSMLYTLNLKMFCENYGIVEHVQYLRVFKTLKSNNLNLHTGFKFKHDLKVKKKGKQEESSKEEELSTDANNVTEKPNTLKEILVTQLQLYLETPSKAYPLGGSIPLKFQFTPLIKNFEIVKIEINLNQKSILWDNNNEKYVKNIVVREWNSDSFDNVSGIEKVSTSAGVKYRLVDSDIDFLYILSIPNKLKEITQNSIIPEHFYNGTINDDDYNQLKVLQLPRISNTHTLSINIFINQPSSKNIKEPLKFSFQLPLILYCSPNIGMQMRKVLLDKFKRVHFRKGEVEHYFPDVMVSSLTKSANTVNKKLSSSEKESSARAYNSENMTNSGANRDLMNSFVQKWFPELQAQNPAPLYTDCWKDDLIESSNDSTRHNEQSIEKTIAAKENLRANRNLNVLEISNNPPTYFNTHFDERNTAINFDHFNILRSERLTRDYFDRLLLGRHQRENEQGEHSVGESTRNDEFHQGILQFEKVAPEYNI